MNIKLIKGKTEPYKPVNSSQFPMYWCGVPAIMKGWIDRVLTLGFAYLWEKPYSPGTFKVRLLKVHTLNLYCILKRCHLLYFVLQDKKAMLSFTTGSHESMFSANGINGDINVTLWPLQVLC